MPGFNVSPMGGGYSPNAPSNITEYKRTNRWVFKSIGRGNGTFTQTELLLLRKAARPNFTFKKLTAHHNQESAHLAGKHEWEPINLVWNDAEQTPDVSRGVYSWVETVINLRTMQVAHPRNYKRTASLAMLDGAGQTIEEWTLYGTWPEKCNWKDLDYEADEIMTLEATMSYDRAVRTCLNAPSPLEVTPSCPV